MQVGELPSYVTYTFSPRDGPVASTGQLLNHLLLLTA